MVAPSLGRVLGVRPEAVVLWGPCAVAEAADSGRYIVGRLCSEDESVAGRFMNRVGDEGMVASGSSSSSMGRAFSIEGSRPRRLLSWCSSSSSTVASRAMTRASRGEAGGLADLRRALTEDRRRLKMKGESGCMLDW